jgi:hypothetical protein
MSSAYEKPPIVPNHRVISGALYQFAASLTCDKRPITASHTHDAAPMAERVNEFCKQFLPPNMEEPLVRHWGQYAYANVERDNASKAEVMDFACGIADELQFGRGTVTGRVSSKVDLGAHDSLFSQSLVALPTPTPGTETNEHRKLREFESELSRLINTASMEGVFGNTPDWVLAKVAVEALKSFGAATVLRDDSGFKTP